MSRCSFLELIRGLSWLRLKTGDDHWSCSAFRIWTVFSANQSTESRRHYSATNSCQNLPRRVGGIINSISSAGPHFTGGGPPHGVPRSRMKCKWCGYWMSGGAAPAPNSTDVHCEAVGLNLPSLWLLPFFHSVFSLCLSLFLFVFSCLFLYILFPSFLSLFNPFSKSFLNNCFSCIYCRLLPVVCFFSVSLISLSYFVPLTPGLLTFRSITTFCGTALQFGRSRDRLPVSPGFLTWHLTVPCALGSTQPLKMSTRLILGVKAAGA
jgi:hypothetical protein